MPETVDPLKSVRVNHGPCPICGKAILYPGSGYCGPQCWVYAAPVQEHQAVILQPLYISDPEEEKVPLFTKVLPSRGTRKHKRPMIEIIKGPTTDPRLQLPVPTGGSDDDSDQPF